MLSQKQKTKTNGWSCNPVVEHLTGMTRRYLGSIPSTAKIKGLENQVQTFYSILLDNIAGSISQHTCQNYSYLPIAALGWLKIEV
jgi:hypothetical protein